VDISSYAGPYIVGSYAYNSNVTVNYGQQPFAASNVTYDQKAGTVEIDGETYNTLYQTWEQYARTALGYTQDQLAEATKKLAGQEPYVQLMKAMIRQWQAGSTYQYGDIVQLNGMTYQAEANEVKLISPDAVTADGAILWRPLVRVAPKRKLERPEPEQPTVLPAPEEEVEFPATGTSAAIMPAVEEEGPSDEEPPKKTNRRRKKS
jgi:hypothetical protein